MPVSKYESFNPKARMGRPPPSWLFTTLPDFIRNRTDELITLTELSEFLSLTRAGARSSAQRYFGQGFMVPKTRKNQEEAWEVKYLKKRLKELREEYPNEVKRYCS